MEYIILILILGIMYSLWPYSVFRCLRDDTKVNWQGETIEPSPFVPNPDNEPYKMPEEDEPCPLKPKKPKPTKRKTKKKTDKDTTKKKGSPTKTRKPRKKREKK